MRVSKTIHVVQTMRREDGGPSRSVDGLVRSILQDLDIDSKILCKNTGINTIFNFELMSDRYIFVSCRFWFVSIFFSIFSVLKKSRDSHVIVHIHGLWDPIPSLAALCCILLNIEYVVHPRGMLEPWSLNQNSLKKRVALFCYQSKFLKKSSAVIVSSELERESVRLLLKSSNLILIPNGLSIYPSYRSSSFLSNIKTVNFLFLSRIHPKKGYHDLLFAFKELKYKNARLILAGPGESNYIDDLKFLIRYLNLSDRVQYIGPVYGEDLIKLYEKASFFVFPSYSENFGMVVPEAMSFGIPVIATEGTPWEGLNSDGCGWFIDRIELLSTLEFACKMSFDDYLIMSGNASASSAKFSWNSIINCYREMYNNF
jgi:glycosyltransferase involved in cell wall biosynthesis